MDRGPVKDAASDAELGYAVTDHVAQSRTVHTGLAVICGTEDRPHAYVALTRGTDTNMAYVFTLSPRRADPGPRPAPELDRYDQIHTERAGVPAPAAPPASPGEALAVLSAVVERDGQLLSAAIAERDLAGARDVPSVIDARLRRHPGQHYPPLRSAEPPHLTPAQRDELTLTTGSRSVRQASGSRPGLPALASTSRGRHPATPQTRDPAITADTGTRPRPRPGQGHGGRELTRSPGVSPGSAPVGFRRPVSCRTAVPSPGTGWSGTR